MFYLICLKIASLEKKLTMSHRGLITAPMWVPEPRISPVNIARRAPGFVRFRL